MLHNLNLKTMTNLILKAKAECTRNRNLARNELVRLLTRPKQKNSVLKDKRETLQ